MVVVHEGPNTFGVGAELTAIVNENAFLNQEAPVVRVTGFDTIVPLPRGEHHYIISPEKIYYGIQKSVKF